MILHYLPLGGERTVTSGDTEEEGIVVDKLARGEDGIVGLRWGMEFGQNFITECLLDPSGEGSGGSRSEERGRRTGRYWQNLQLFRRRP